MTLALAVYQDSANQAILATRHGKVPSEAEFFNLYQSPGSPCATKRSGVDLAWVMANVRPLAADLILAHPFVPVSLIIPPLRPNEVEELMDRGLYGVEIYHTRTSDEQISYLEQLCHQRSLKHTGGSDNHGKVGNASLGTYGRSRDVPSYMLTNYAG